MSLANLHSPQSKKAPTNTFKKEADTSMIKLYSSALKGHEPEFGDMTVAVDALDVSYQEYWFRGG